MYDASGKMLAEYSTIVESQSTAKVSYLTTDHLGSPRILTDAVGQVISRRDFHPFGEEIITAQRTQGLGYTADSVRQKFTGYEHDNESGLDFAQARMYLSKLGRFTSTDPSRKSVKILDPQTWNRFVYCLNNPHILVDKNGKWGTKVHNAILTRALDRMASLEPKLLKSVQNGSYKTDIDGLNLKTMYEKNAPQHAMTPGSKVKELGLEKAKEWAKNESINFIEGKLGEAKNLYDKMKVTPDVGRYKMVQDSLEKFGEAMHPVMDNFSPSHKGFQVFEYKYKSLLGSPASDLIQDANDLLEHSKIEDRDPTEDEMNMMVDEIRLRFLQTYGNEAYEQAVSEEERRATAARLAKRGTQGMLVR